MIRLGCPHNVIAVRHVKAHCTIASVINCFAGSVGVWTKCLGVRGSIILVVGMGRYLQLAQSDRLAPALGPHCVLVPRAQHKAVSQVGCPV